MKRTETLQVLRACCIAAETLNEAWKSMLRKDKDYCNVAMTFEGAEPDTVDMVEFQVTWEDLESGLSIGQMAYEIFSACWLPPAGSKELSAGVPADRVLN